MTYDNDKDSDLHERIDLNDKPWVSPMEEEIQADQLVPPGKRFPRRANTTLGGWTQSDQPNDLSPLGLDQDLDDWRDRDNQDRHSI